MDDANKDSTREREGIVMNYEALKQAVAELGGRHHVRGYSTCALLKLTVWYAGLVTEAPLPQETRQIQTVAGKEAICPELTPFLEEAVKHITCMF